MSNSTQTVLRTLDKPWLFNQKHNQKAVVPNQYLQQVAVIHAKCKKLLSLMNNDELLNNLYAIMDNANKLLAMTAGFGKKPTEKQLDELLSTCQELQLDALNLPSNFPSENTLAALNYKIAVACFYLLVTSLCLTAGAVFGAWYFEFLTTQYFIHTLIGALSAIGIPAVCLGLFSFGLYSAQSDSQVEYQTIADDVGNFCDCIVKDYELMSELETAKTTSL